MAQARYIVAVLLLATVPISLGLWFAIHPFARSWRRIGPAWTYAILAAPCLLVGWILWHARRTLLGPDLGTRPGLLVLAIAAAIVGLAISRARRRRLGQLTLMGIPELSSRQKGRLATEGIYSRIRNPRYLEFLAFVLAYAAFANHLGIWVLYLLSLPTIHGVVLMEERELRDRFRAEYEEYCRQVPRYLPRRR